MLVEFERKKFPTFDPDTDPAKADPDPQHMDACVLIYVNASVPNLSPDGPCLNYYVSC